MNNTSLAIIQPQELDTIQRAARILAVSSYFDGKGDNPQAIAMIAVKIMAGREMGFGPFASANGIHIISGRPSVGANLMACAVKGSGRYDYRVKEMTNDVCSIEFFEREGDKKVSIGISTFTKADAKDAGTQNMTKFARNMLFARAMSNGVRWYCPDVFNGNAVYVPEELGAEVDGDGNVIDVTPRQVDADTGEIDTGGFVSKSIDGYNLVSGLNGDVLFAKAEPLTDEEHDITTIWQTWKDAKEWAVAVGACENVHEAENSIKKAARDAGLTITQDNKKDGFLVALRHWNKKLAQQPHPEGSRAEAA